MQSESRSPLIVLGQQSQNKDIRTKCKKLDISWRMMTESPLYHQLKQNLFHLSKAISSFTYWSSRVLNIKNRRVERCRHIYEYCAKASELHGKPVIVIAFYLSKKHFYTTHVLKVGALYFFKTIYVNNIRCNAGEVFSTVLI